MRHRMFRGFDHVEGRSAARVGWVDRRRRVRSAGRPSAVGCGRVGRPAASGAGRRVVRRRRVRSGGTNGAASGAGRRVVRRRSGAARAMVERRGVGGRSAVFGRRKNAGGRTVGLADSALGLMIKPSEHSRSLCDTKWAEDLIKSLERTCSAGSTGSAGAPPTEPAALWPRDLRLQRSRAYSAAPRRQRPRLQRSRACGASRASAQPRADRGRACSAAAPTRSRRLQRQQHLGVDQLLHRGPPGRRVLGVPGGGGHRLALSQGRCGTGRTAPRAPRTAPSTGC